MSFADILSLLESPVPFRYAPVVRDAFVPTPEDVERMRFYSTIPFISTRSREGVALKARWAEKTHGLSAEHVRAIETRGISLRYDRPVEGSDEWRHTVFGYTTAEYDEMDRVGLLRWEESFRVNEDHARGFREAFLALSFEEQVTCARGYRNAPAWEFFESLFSEEDKDAIRSEADFLDREEDAMDRYEHERDD